MRWPSAHVGGHPVVLMCAVASASLGTRVMAADAPAFRYDAPIEVRAPAPFVQLALSPDVYAHAALPGLGDLRIVDAKGERVPFALIAPASPLPASERVREATLYPLPARPAAGGEWPSPVDVVVEGDRITLSRHAAASAGTLAARPPASSAGWLIDTGERRMGEVPPRALRLAWSGPTEFAVAYRFESSDDLRGWRAGGEGQLMALQSAAASALTQPLVSLPAGTGRFVRLLWSSAADAPVVTGAVALSPERGFLVAPAAAETTVGARAAPAAANGDADARRGVEFDLGAALPVLDVDLRFASGNHVAPVRVQGRVDEREPWRELGAGVFYRLEHGGVVGESPALAMPATVRFVRIVADERAALLDAREIRLAVHTELASLVFVAQGQPPFRLLAGSRDAPSGAMPVATLIPRLDDERTRFGRAVVGPFAEVDAVARADARADRQARLRPWVLWGVIVAGVAGLAGLVWRLSRAPPADGEA